MFMLKKLSGRELAAKAAKSGKSHLKLFDAAWVGGLLEAKLTRVLADKPAREWVQSIVEKEARFFEKLDGADLVDLAGHEESVVEAFARVLERLLREVGEATQAAGEEEGALVLEVAAIELCADPRALVQMIVSRLVPLHFDGGRPNLGAGLAKTVVANLCKASKVTEQQAREKPTTRLKWPKDSDLDASELVRTYLGGTGLEKLLTRRRKVTIPDRIRSEHTLIVGGSGWGKSQLLGHMIASDLDRATNDPVGLVIIDSQGDLCNRVARLKHFTGNDRLLLVDGSDEHAPALSLFDLGVNAKGLSTKEREAQLSAAVELGEHILGSLMGAELSSKQSTVFKFVVELLVGIEHSNLHTLRRLLEEPKDFLGEIEKLAPTAKQFFKQEFLGKGFGTTRKELLRRVYALLANRQLERIFGASANKLDMFDAMNRSRVVVVNTSKEYLKSHSSTFARFIVALCVMAAFRRASIAPEARRQCHLIIDEAADVMDESIGTLLIQARKYKLSLVAAIQACDQLPEKIRALALSNTAIKCAGGVSGKDSRLLAPELRTSPEHILGQTKDKDGAEFATFVRGLTPGCVTWRIPFGTLEGLPTMTDREFESMLARNRAELCA